jgi:hypothetical protein
VKIRQKQKLLVNVLADCSSDNIKTIVIIVLASVGVQWTRTITTGKPGDE